MLHSFVSAGSRSDYYRMSFAGLLLLVFLTSCSPSSPPPEPEAMQAVRAAEQIAGGLKDGNMHVLWDCWTDSQREDVNQLVHKFAEKMPVPLWENSFQVVEFWGRALKEKREFALNCPHLKKGHANLEKHGETLSDFLIQLAKSDFRRLDKLNTADAGDLFKQIDPYLMNAVPAVFGLFPNPREEQVALESWENSLNMFTSASFALGEHEEDWAVVHTAHGRDAVTKIRFIKVSERWVPELPAEDWEQAMTAANQWLEDFRPETFPPLVILNATFESMVKPRLKQVLEAQTQSEFDEIFADSADPILPYFFFAAEKKFTIPQ